VTQSQTFPPPALLLGELPQPVTAMNTNNMEISFGIGPTLSILVGFVFKRASTIPSFVPGQRQLHLPVSGHLGLRRPRGMKLRCIDREPDVLEHTFDVRARRECCHDLHPPLQRAVGGSWARTSLFRAAAPRA
jgi:hypothetical protein